MGKSSTGKDTVFKKICASKSLELRNIVPYTTRPIREGEKEGVEYHFVSAGDFESLSEAGKVIESRCYETCHGPWIYFTVDDENTDLDHYDYITIGTLESFVKVRDHYGPDKVVPVLIELDDGIRLTRALEREKRQEHPKYEEMCRRFLADSEDYSEEKIREAGITTRFENNVLEQCVEEIIGYFTRDNDQSSR